MSHLPAAATIAVQGTLALDLAGARPGLPETPELHTRSFSRVTELADHEVRAWAARFSQGVVEALGGHRPVTQLLRWTSPQIYHDLERRARQVRQAADLGTRSVRAQVRSVHVCRPAPDVAEVSVHVRHARRSRALALRLERRQGRWVCTVLQFG